MNSRIKKDANYIQNLVEYAKRNLKKGYTLDSLKWALISQGHSRIEVDKALAAAQAEVTKENMVANRVQPTVAQSTQNPTLQIDPEQRPSLWKRWFK